MIFQVALDPEKLAGSTLEVFLALLKSIFDVSDENKKNKVKPTNL